MVGKEIFYFIKTTLDKYNEIICMKATELGLTKGEADVLLFFHINPSLRNAKDLVKRTNVSKAYVSKAMSLLIDKKLIKIVSDKSDKRYQNIKINNSALKIINTLEKEHDIFFKNMLKGLDKNEKEYFIKVLSKIEKNIVGMGEKYD